MVPSLQFYLCSPFSETLKFWPPVTFALFGNLWPSLPHFHLVFIFWWRTLAVVLILFCFVYKFSFLICLPLHKPPVLTKENRLSSKRGLYDAWPFLPLILKLHSWTKFYSESRWPFWNKATNQELCRGLPSAVEENEWAETLSFVTTHTGLFFMNYMF